MKIFNLKKYISYAIIVLVVLSVFSSCYKNDVESPDETEEPYKDKFTLAEGVTIPRYYYDYYLNLGNNEEDALELATELTVKVLIAEEENLSISEQKKNSLVTKIIYEFEDNYGVSYEDSVYNEYGVSPENLIQIKLDEVLVGLLLQKIGNEIVTLQMAEEYYNAHKDEFYTVTFLYGFMDISGYNEEFSQEFQSVSTRDDMFSFIEKYSESDSKEEDVYLDISKSSSLPSEVIGVLDNDISLFSTFLIETEDKLFFLMCDYISDFSSTDIQNTIIDLLIEQNANDELDLRVNEKINSFN